MSSFTSFSSKLPRNIRKLDLGNLNPRIANELSILAQLPHLRELTVRYNPYLDQPLGLKMNICASTSLISYPSLHPSNISNYPNFPGTNPFDIPRTMSRLIPDFSHILIIIVS
ncbi:hypothetical protein K435DRAFT_93369 [Dendrothele bispora CBS 962.96]|uniref:Uncharacterized protein n=1 Tax=Dendrothele bispora (strain CBS 962.96) TaxID=1314807 RepID=A0A4S8MRA1_DENBC|nr:hypothetical protein K435DRAFT_93369 [Dendrothele bispora CBS 962.96]